MKKNYVSPSAEKINFEYRDQVVVASGSACYIPYINYDTSGDKICDPTLENPSRPGTKNNL